MPRINLQLVQGAGGPSFDNVVAVTKANPAARISAALLNSGGVSEQSFNVTSYGADPTGVADSNPGIRATYLAARAYSVNGLPSRVYFPPGTYSVRFSTSWNLLPIRTDDYVGQTSPTIPSGANRGTIRFSGYNATIKYVNETGRHCWLQGPNPTAQYSTYGNLIIEGFTIDNNNRQPTQEVGTVLWMQGNGNVTNVTFNDVTMLNNMAYRTTAAQSTALNGVLLICRPVNRSQSYWGYTTNIDATDCVFYGQAKAFSVVCGGDGETTRGTNKYLIDNINLTRSYFNTNHFYGSNAHLGSYASSYRCTVTDCTFEDSCDDGLEIDAFNQATVTGCTFSKCRQPICIVWFSFPYKSDVPEYVIDGCTYTGDCNSYWLKDVAVEPGRRSPMMPEIRWDKDYSVGLTTRSWGNVTIKNCTMDFGITNSYSIYRSPFTIGSSGLPLSSVTIDNCDITDGQTGGDVIDIRQGSQLGTTLPVTITDVRHRASTGAAYHLISSTDVTIAGDCSVTSDIAGL